MYAVDGARELPERELDHLPGYAGSRPVRIGNGAVDQRQTDVLGEVMVALELARQAGIGDSDDSWALQRDARRRAGRALGRAGQRPLGDPRRPQRHFTHSRVMVWAAFDRAVAAVEQHGLRRARSSAGASCATQVRARGARARASTASAAPSSSTTTPREVDASLLLIPHRRVPARRRPAGAGHHRGRRGGPDARRACCCATAPTAGVDGLAGDEHPFLACSFWLVSAYAAGRAPATRPTR